MLMPTVSHAARRGMALALALPLSLACTGETVHAPTQPDESALYWDLHLNHHAVMLSTVAPYDTLTLVATPRNVANEPLTGLPAPQYVSQNSDYVLVTPDGVLVAIAPMAPGTHITVVATLTAGNLKHSDSVLVRVIADPSPPMLASFSVHPLLPDSAKVAAVRDGADMIVADTLPVRAIDATGAPMQDLLVSFRGSDREIAIINETTGRIEGLLPGRTTIYAGTTAFGVAKADTLPYRIGLPISGRFVVFARSDGAPGSVLQERRLRLGVGAAVYWQAIAADTTTDVDITFTDPTHVAAFPGSSVYPISPFPFYCDFYGPEVTDCTDSGNLMLRRGNSPFFGIGFGIGVRTFPVAGMYEFHSALQGFDGRIVVVDESDE